MWSPWPWVSNTWVTPSATSSHPLPQDGFPVRKGSIRMAASPTSIRNAECPYQVSFIGRASSLYRDVQVRTRAVRSLRIGPNVPVIDIAEVAHLATPGTKLAGIDLGTKTIGLAISDARLAFAHPRPVIMRKKFSIDAQALLSEVQNEKVVGIVIGLPVNMDGSEGPRVQATRAFVR